MSAKPRLQGGQVVLRSKTPELVEQEFYGMMLAHRAVRTLVNEAALRQIPDPDGFSFTVAIRVIRRELAANPAFPPRVRRAGLRSCGFGRSLGSLGRSQPASAV